MNRTSKFANVVLSAVIALTLILSAVQPVTASASVPALASTSNHPDDGLRRSVHSQTGKLTFLGADPVSPVRVNTAMKSGLMPEVRGTSILEVYGPEFGIRDPKNELSLIEANSADGRAKVRYQQVYNKIPVLGGELIVNMLEDGSLLSINGEVSPDLKLGIRPVVTAERARLLALNVVAESQGVDASTLKVNEPALWIFDERLLQDNATKPVHLVWRLEVSSATAPIRELVLVNTINGSISLHFNQVDTAWTNSATESKTVQVKDDFAEPFAQPSIKSAPISTIKLPSPNMSGFVGTPQPGNLFVSTTGNDANDCLSPSTACKIIDAAIAKPQAANNSIFVESGVYTEGWHLEVVQINKSIILSGGWNSDFSQQNGYSIIDGKGTREGVVVSNSSITATIDRFIVQNSKRGLVNYGNLSVLSSTVQNNHTTGMGGGIYNGNQLFILNSTIANNSAFTGGGIYNYSSAVSMSIQNSTIVSNSVFGSSSGGGIYSWYTTDTIKNSIVKNNIPTNCTNGGGFNSQGHNIFGPADKCDVNPGPGDLFNVDPLLTSFPVGPGGYYALKPGSPAINAGDPTGCPGFDQRGVARTTCDIGAYEYSTAGAASVIVVAFGADQRVGLEMLASSSVGVYVLDNLGSPLTGTQVTFSAPVVGASGAFPGGGITAVVSTNDSGLAIAPVFKANDSLGSYALEAGVNGTGLTVSLPMTNVEPLYISTLGNDSNTCVSPDFPCATIQGAINKAVAGDPIKVASGHYTEDPTIDRSITLSGGWNADFSAQEGVTLIDGGFLVNAGTVVSMEHFTVENAPTNGIFSKGKLTLRNVTVHSNNPSASSIGAGIINQGEMSIISSTIVSNGYAGIRNESSPVVIHNSIIANHTSNCAGGGWLQSLGHNIIGSGCQLVVIQPSDQVNIDPMVTMYPVGVGRLYALRPGSPAIDSGDPAFCESADERGVARPQGAACDIGAYEYVAPGTANIIGVAYGPDQIVGVGRQASQPLVVYITDAIGSPVPGVNVTFTAPPSGASGSFTGSGTNSAIVTTTDGGLAIAPAYTVNYILGSYVVVATGAGVDGSVNFNFSNVATYVSPLGNDVNTCSTPADPCATIEAALDKAFVNTTVYVTSGVYTGRIGWRSEVVTIRQNTDLSGGWNTDFTDQTGVSVIDGQGTLRGIWIDSGVYSSIERFVIRNSPTGVLSRGQTTIKTSVIQGNEIGVHVDATTGTTMMIVNSTITHNGENRFEHVATVSNSIIATNSYDCSGTLNSLGFNIVGNTVGCNITSGPGDKLNVDPLLSSYVVSPFGYYAIRSDSPAIDAGNPSGCGGTDIRGVTRPQGAACDIGAYEYIAPGTVETFEIAFGSGQRIGPEMISNSQLGVYVLDGNGSPVPGVSVTFTAPASGASVIFASTGTNSMTVTTNDSGLAETTDFRANGTLGSYLINASIGGVPGSVDFNTTNVEPLYVSPLGNNTIVTYNDNTCSNSSTPCATIYHALSKALSGDPIKIAIGTYTTSSWEVASIQKDIFLSGGWTADFTSQTGASVFDGQWTARGVVVNAGITATIERLTIKNGSNNAGGGGVVNRGKLTIRNTTIYSNKWLVGAGILHEGQGLTILNSTISNNLSTSTTFFQVDVGGAGLYISNGGDHVFINNSTFTQNISMSAYYEGVGGGIWNPTNIPIFIANSIVAGNGAEISPECAGKIISYGHNLVGTITGCGFVAAPTDLIPRGLDGPLAAMLGDLKENSGILTHALQPDSPAIDAGDPTTCDSFDQRGTSRPQGIACDIGAFEGSVAETATPKARTYTVSNQLILPGTLLCDGDANSCIPGSDTHTTSAHTFALGTYQLYLFQHGRAGIDNNNLPMISSVHYKSGYQNAFWNGYQMVYGDGYGFPLADDVVAHELTHGVTQYESNLFYWYQSGAINESFSDLWGEAFDLIQNITAGDTVATKWLLGEDVSGLGAIRNMSNPPAYGDPDSMTSANYCKTGTCATEDNGGVHTNSGVNNKAVSLMVDGGTFNNIVVSPLGWPKVLTIYYEAQTNLLTSGSDYLDLYNALYQACLNKVGSNGITLADCQEVQDAANAVKMNVSPGVVFNPDADYCPVGTSKHLSLYTESFETGIDDWAISALSGKSAWTVSEDYAVDGISALFSNDGFAVSDSVAAMNAGVLIPLGTNSYLHFAHAFAFQYIGTNYYDGGVLEYSTDNGLTWLDARPKFNSGKDYDDSLETGVGNPLGGRYAFVGDSHGYVDSRYDLTTLAGKTVRFRWRLGTSYNTSVMGWYIDDIRIYTCVGVPSTPSLTAPADNALLTDYTPTLDWSDTTAYLDHYELNVAKDANFTVDSSLKNVPVSTYTFPDSQLIQNTTYYWRVRSINAAGGASLWSATRSFRTALAPPTSIEPGDLYPTTPPAVNIHTRRPDFIWDAVPGATGYTVEIVAAQYCTSFSTKFLTASVTTTTYTATKDLAAGAVYCWRVRSNGTNGPSAYSQVRTFTTGNPPTIPALVTPANGVLLMTTAQPTFDWKDATFPSGTFLGYYDFQIDTTNLFTAPTTFTNITSSILTPPKVGFPDLTPATTYYWRVRAVNTATDKSGWSAPFSFRIAYQAPLSISPGDLYPTTPPAVNIHTRRPDFTWDIVPGATGYTVEVVAAQYCISFSTKFLTASVTTNSYTATKDLAAGAVYCWRVRATGTYGPSAYSQVRTFTTGNPPSTPKLTAPANNALLASDAQPLFEWADSTSTVAFDHYEFQIDTTSTFASATTFTTAPGQITDSDLTPPTLGFPVLNRAATYYWRVRAWNTAGDFSGWSVPFSFRVAYAAPTLLTPLNGATLLTLKPTFTWNVVLGATSYKIQVSTSPTFSTTVVNATVTSPTYVRTTSLTAKKTYYWRVQALGTYGPSAWSAVWIFITP